MALSKSWTDLAEADWLHLLVPAYLEAYRTASVAPFIAQTIDDFDMTFPESRERQAEAFKGTGTFVSLESRITSWFPNHTKDRHGLRSTKPLKANRMSKHTALKVYNEKHSDIITALTNTHLAYALDVYRHNDVQFQVELAKQKGQFLKQRSIILKQQFDEASAEEQADCEAVADAANADGPVVDERARRLNLSQINATLSDVAELIFQKTGRYIAVLEGGLNEEKKLTSTIHNFKSINGKYYDQSVPNFDTVVLVPWKQWLATAFPVDGTVVIDTSPRIAFTKNGVPILPNINDPTLKKHSQRQAMMTLFITAAWRWCGGKGKPPYADIVKDQNRFIDPGRLPPGFPFLHPTKYKDPQMRVLWTCIYDHQKPGAARKPFRFIGIAARNYSRAHITVAAVMKEGAKRAAAQAPSAGPSVPASGTPRAVRDSDDEDDEEEAEMVVDEQAATPTGNPDATMVDEQSDDVVRDRVTEDDKADKPIPTVVKLGAYEQERLANIASNKAMLAEVMAAKTSDEVAEIKLRYLGPPLDLPKVLQPWTKSVSPRSALGADPTWGEVKAYLSTLSPDDEYQQLLRVATRCMGSGDGLKEDVEEAPSWATWDSTAPVLNEAFHVGGTSDEDEVDTLGYLLDWVETKPYLDERGVVLTGTGGLTVVVLALGLALRDLLLAYTCVGEEAGMEEVEVPISILHSERDFADEGVTVRRACVVMMDDLSNWLDDHSDDVPVDISSAAPKAAIQAEVEHPMVGEREGATGSATAQAAALDTPVAATQRSIRSTDAKAASLEVPAALVEQPTGKRRRGAVEEEKDATSKEPPVKKTRFKDPVEEYDDTKGRGKREAKPSVKVANRLANELAAALEKEAPKRGRKKA